MSRPLVLGNGQLLVGLDHFAQVRDCYFDYVGLENHMTEDSSNKVGVFVDNQISWLDSGEWNILIDYMHETLAGTTIAVNSRLNIELHLHDVVYNESPIFVRKVTVKNKAAEKRNIKIFFNHQFRMYGEEKKDTAYYDPEDTTIVHYKGRRIAIIGGSLNGDPFKSYSVGLSKIEGKEGTWVDAEDGVLSNHPIEHGTVDSTIMFEDTTDANSAFTVFCVNSFAKDFETAKALHQYALAKTPDHLIETTQDYWNAWVNKLKYNFYELDTKVVDLFKKSLLILRTHVDNTGAIIASADSGMLQYGRDNYSYVWPRDAAFVAHAFDKAGYPEVSRKFFEFANETICREGYFFHKYRPDKSVGSSWHPWINDGNRQLPIQEDETALVIYSLWEHYRYSKDLEFIESIYNSLIKKAGNFMLGFRNANKLPFPSYDLWEMKYGTHTFTAAAVSGGLAAASHFARLLGKEKDQHLFAAGAAEVKEAILKHLYNEKADYFYKLIDFKAGNILHDETIDASTFYAIFKFGILEHSDKRLQKIFRTFQKTLATGSKINGVARFENDIYYQKDSSTPGNPWIITTLWLVQYLITQASSPKDFLEIKNWLNWTVKYALPSGVLSEQLDPNTAEQVSASPLAWSHAEFIITVIDYLERLTELGICESYYQLK